MSLSCVIKVFNSSDEPFKPMQRINGIIRYTAYEDILLKRIIISLKGNGILDLQGKTRRKFREDYVDIDKVVQENTFGFILAAGTYEESFSFKLPEKIPSSIETKQINSRHIVNCNVQYYVRIKFDRGVLKSDKTFKKNISVQSTIIPRLPKDPVRYTKRKYFKGLLSDLSGMIYIRAAIENSVICPGDQIMIHYILKNLTKVELKGVTIKLVEVYSFKPNRPLINSKNYHDIGSTVITTSTITAGETFPDTVTLHVPADLSSLEHSTLVTRDYYVKVVVELPLPHRNIVLKIPVQIEREDNTEVDGDRSPSYEEIVDEFERRAREETLQHLGPPPSYWQTMVEMISELPEEELMAEQPDVEDER